MSLLPSTERERPHYFWLSLGLTAFTVAALILSGRHAWAAAGLGIALAVAFFRLIWHEIAARTLAYLGVGIVAYLIAWNRGVPFLYAFSAACFALVVIAHLLPRWVLRPVQGRINAPPSILQGGTAELSIAMENPGTVSLRMLELEVPVPGAIGDAANARALLMKLEPGATEHLHLRTPPLRRGCHTLGPITVTTGFPLGVTSRSLTVPGSERTLWVYPRLFSVEFLPVAGEQFQQMGEAISPRTGGGEDFAGVREYRHGDSRRSIHWRASARHNELVVKEFMRTVATTITVAVDLGRTGNVGEGIDTAAEDAIRIAGSIARYALGQRHHVQLALCGASFQRVGPFEDLAELEIIMRALAVARSDGEEPFAAHLPRIAGIAPPNSTVVLVHMDATAGVPVTVTTLREHGVLVVPIVIEAASYVPRLAPIEFTAAKRSGSRRVRRGIDLAPVFRE